MSFFNNANTNNQGGGLFGSSTANSSQPAQSGGLFGSAQPQQNTGLFGASTTSSQPQQNSLFGAATSNSQSQQTSSLFGKSGGLFGQPASQVPQQQNTSLFGANADQQKANTGSLFGGLGQSAQQQQQQQQPQPQSQPGNSLFGQSQGSRIWNEQDQVPRQKSVAEQISLVYQKWEPNSPSSLFHAYLYNTVNPDAAPFYRPDPSENEEKWEEALRKAPFPSSIPFLVKGFQQLGHRIINQERHLSLLQGRLHEINNGLSDILRRHDLEISTRAADCRRRHVRLAQKSLALATKTQVLRNRGYALDGAEEELAQVLKKLERQVLDPALSGRAEEIWARMVGVRERGRLLQAEFERAGSTTVREEEGTIDEETLKRAKKILEDYDSQLTHLAKELDQIKEDYQEWEDARPAPSNGYARPR